MERIDLLTRRVIRQTVWEISNGAGHGCPNPRARTARDADSAAEMVKEEQTGARWRVRWRPEWNPGWAEGNVLHAGPAAIVTPSPGNVVRPSSFQHGMRPTVPVQPRH